MTKKTTRKKTAPSKTPAPMDPEAVETATPTPMSNNQRVCYALETLVAEAQQSFPGLSVEYSAFDGRNTALAATFDLTSVHEPEPSMLRDGLGLVVGDPRVADVVADESAVTVTMHSNPRTQDSREPFNLADAMFVLGGESS